MNNDKAGCLGLENTQKDLATEKQVRIEADAQLMQNMSSLEITVTNETTNRQEADTVLQTAIDNESSARQEADSNLQAAIAAEISDRQEAVATLQTAIANEAATRQSSDNALQLVIDAEAVDRKAAISTLDAAINKEVSDRQEADNALQVDINGKAASTHTHSDKSNFKNITMVGLGFTKDSYVSVRDFWQALYSKIGTNGCIQFTWANASAAYVGVAGNCVYLNGGSLFFTMTSYPATWHTFSAIYVGGSDGSFYHIKCCIGSDGTVGNESWYIDRIAKKQELASKSDTSHNHDSSYYTKSATDSLLSGKSNTSHTHDDRYYTESEINSKLANYANVYIGSSQPSSSESAKLWVVI